TSVLYDTLSLRTTRRARSNVFRADRYSRSGAVLRRRAADHAGRADPLQPPSLDITQASAAPHRAAAQRSGALVCRAAFTSLGGADQPAVYQRGNESIRSLSAGSRTSETAIGRIFSRES